MSKSNLRSSAAISIAVMSSRILGLVRDALFLALFPVGILSDAYRVAYLLPNLLRDLFAEGALSSAFVPTFTESLKNEGDEGAHRLANLVMTGLLLSTGILCVAGIIWIDPLVGLLGRGGAAGAEKAALTARLAVVMMPILVIVSVSAAWMGMLNARSLFAAPAFAPAAFNVVSIIAAAVLIGFGMGTPRGLMWFSLATVAASLAQAFFQIPSLWRTGYRPRLTLGGVARHKGVRKILRLMAPAVLGLAAVQVNVLVNTHFALLLGDGPATYLVNAFRLFYLPVGLFGVALATVTTTRVSEEAARGDRGAMARQAGESIRGVWMLALPSTVGLFLLAEPVVSMVFLRGAFTQVDARATAEVLQMYVLGVLPYSLVKNLAPSFYAVSSPRTPMLASMAGVVVNLAFNAATYRTLGAPGLALGTTLGVATNMVILRWRFTTTMASPLTSGWGRQFVGLCLANGILAGVILAAQWGLPQIFASGFTLGRGSLGAGALLVTITVAFVVYAWLLGRLGYPGAGELTTLPGKILRRLRPKRRAT